MNIQILIGLGPVWSVRCKDICRSSSALFSKLVKKSQSM